MPMDAVIFVQNVNSRCKVKGVSPTVACVEAGVGNSFIANIKKGQTPSVANVQKLATYLGTTVSALLGEKVPSTDTDGGPTDYELVALWQGLSPTEALRVKDFVQGMIANRTEPPAPKE